jgi:hypothetical protein
MEKTTGPVGSYFSIDRLPVAEVSSKTGGST